MTVLNSILLADIHAFIEETGMGKQYFGKAACGNSEVVKRLENGGRVWPETEAKIRAFILLRRKQAPKKDLSATEDIQGRQQKKAEMS